MELLLRRRADPGARNRKEQTPLDLCKDEGLREVLRAAVEAKAAAAAAGELGSRAGLQGLRGLCVARGAWGGGPAGARWLGVGV